MGCHLLPQGIFLTQGSNLPLLYWFTDSLPLSHQGSPATNTYLVKWVLLRKKKEVKAPKRVTSGNSVQYFIKILDNILSNILLDSMTLNYQCLSKFCQIIGIVLKKMTLISIAQRRKSVDECPPVVDFCPGAMIHTDPWGLFRADCKFFPEKVLTNRIL